MGTRVESTNLEPWALGVKDGPRRPRCSAAYANANYLSFPRRASPARIERLGLHIQYRPLGAARLDDPLADRRLAGQVGGGQVPVNVVLGIRASAIDDIAPVHLPAEAAHIGGN